MILMSPARWPPTLFCLEPPDLDEFVFRFNRRRTRHAAFRSLLGMADARGPLTYNMLIAPEAKA
jgi:hypothetical protein